MHNFQRAPELGEDPTNGAPKFGFTVDGTFIFDPRLSECGRFAVDPMDTYLIPEADVLALEALNKAVEDAAEDALNAGALAIQKALGVETGDFAGVYFSGAEQRRKLEKLFAEYMLAEMRAAPAMDLADLNEMDAKHPGWDQPQPAPAPAAAPAKVQWESLTSGVRARVRLGRHGASAINWEPPLETGLFLQRDPKGRVCVVAVMERPDFAEFDPRHDTEGPNLLCTEDYALEVLEVPVSGAPAA